MSIIISETTWLESVADTNVVDSPDGNGKIATFILQNGHRYVIPMQGKMLQRMQRGLSPLTVVGANEIPPTNGQGD